MVRSAAADSYFFHIPAVKLAELYGKYGEGLLQRNIRAWQKETATNRSVETTCTGDDSGNFLHYNNGVTFLCDSAGWDQFQEKLTLIKAQVVNGGQTIRVLGRTHKQGTLKPNVLVPARVITAEGSKEFASNVAINQNNQNQMGTGFLRSNDPRVVQLAHALSSLGWYLERRAGELDATDAGERVALAQQIGRAGEPLDPWVIRLKEGTQAYAATFFGQPELAKKNPKEMFLAQDDGGSFEKIFSADLTAEKLVIAHQIKATVDDFVGGFNTRKHRKERTPNWEQGYRQYLGSQVMDDFPDEVDQVVPQSGIFLCGTVFKDLVTFQGKAAKEIPKHLRDNGSTVFQSHLWHILNFVRQDPAQKIKSWPSLLKSNTLFTNFVSYLGGVRGFKGKKA
jgi:hypothetical protein